MLFIFSRASISSIVWRMLNGSSMVAEARTRYLNLPYWICHEIDAKQSIDLNKVWIKFLFRSSSSVNAMQTLSRPMWRQLLFCAWNFTNEFSRRKNEYSGGYCIRYVSVRLFEFDTWNGRRHISYLFRRKYHSRVCDSMCLRWTFGVTVNLFVHWAVEVASLWWLKLERIKKKMRLLKTLNLSWNTPNE